jgi:AbiU2
MKAADTEFGRELEIFRQEEETAQQYFFAYLAIRDLAAGDKDMLRLLNSTPLFWITTHHALVLAAFVALGRVFDQHSRHNLDRVLKLATQDLSLFAKTALARRKEEDGITRAQAEDYVSSAYEPTAADFRLLRKEVTKRRRVYEARYRDVRDKIFAHKELSNTNDANALLAKTNIEEMKGIFAFLYALHDSLWELLFNGRRPVLRIQEFVLPPSSVKVGQAVKPGEKVAHEVRAFFQMAAPTAARGNNT